MEKPSMKSSQPVDSDKNKQVKTQNAKVLKSKILKSPIPQERRFYDDTVIPSFDLKDTREQLKQLLFTVKAVRSGDFAVRMPNLHEGIIAEIGEVLNDIIE